MIESRHNRRLKHIRGLKRSKGDDALLDTPRLVLEAARLGLRFDELLATIEFVEDPRRSELLAELPRSPTIVAAPLLREVVDVTTPAGIVATVPMARSNRLIERARRVVYVDRLRDPSNLGALARAAEASGVDQLVLRSGTVHPNHPRALRASAGSLLRLPVAVGLEPADLADRWALSAGQNPGTSAIAGTTTTAWLSLTVDGGASLYETDLPHAWILAVGSETGLSSEVDAMASFRLSIPTAPAVESLNAMQAATVALFELARRRGTP